MSAHDTNEVRRHARSVADRAEELDDDDADGWHGVAADLEQAHGHAKTHAGETSTRQAVDREFKKSGRESDSKI